MLQLHIIKLCDLYLLVGDFLADKFNLKNPNLNIPKKELFSFFKTSESHTAHFQKNFSEEHFWWWAAFD